MEDVDHTWARLSELLYYLLLNNSAALEMTLKWRSHATAGVTLKRTLIAMNIYKSYLNIDQN
jgi:hypothetical protein